MADRKRTDTVDEFYVDDATGRPLQFLFVPAESLFPHCNRRGASYIEGIYPQST